jgi:hypothetical protein
MLVDFEKSEIIEATLAGSSVGPVGGEGCGIVIAVELEGAARTVATSFAVAAVDGAMALS